MIYPYKVTTLSKLKEWVKSNNPKTIEMDKENREIYHWLLVPEELKNAYPFKEDVILLFDGIPIMER